MSQASQGCQYYICRYVTHDLPDLTGPCNIKRRDLSLSKLDFVTEYVIVCFVILCVMYMYMYM